MHRRGLALPRSCLLAALALGRLLPRSRVAEAPRCPLTARGRVGATWADRTGVAGEPVPGELEDFDVYDREGFDAADVHPEIRRFYERTAEYDLAYETRWHRGFRTGARLASIATTRLEQLNLPGRSDGRVRRLESRIAKVPPAVDPRGSRVWTRTDPDTGEAVFVAVYATHERDGATYANVAVPLPRSNLWTILRPEAIGGGDGYAGVEFTTRGRGGGLYLATPIGAHPLPMDQSFRVRPVEGSDARGTSNPASGPALAATHEMWLFDRRFLTIRYAIARSSGG